MTISHAIFHRKVKNWIFLKFIWNGLLKNVQYGISRLLRSGEVQQTKAETVLVDTLYLNNYTGTILLYALPQTYKVTMEQFWNVCSLKMGNSDPLMMIFVGNSQLKCTGKWWVVGTWTKPPSLTPGQNQD